MIVCHKHRFIFIKTKKVAGTSVELFLSKFCGSEDIITPVSADEEMQRAGLGAQNWRMSWNTRNRLLRIVGGVTGNELLGYGGFKSHTSAAGARQHLGEEIWNSYFKFTVERNPWDRQVSLYHWSLRSKRKVPTFTEFLTNPIYINKLNNFDIYSIDGKVAVDHVCRYENLAADLSAVLRRLGLDDTVELPRAKSGFRKDGKHWRDYYTPRTRDIVGGWYSREIEAFGYTFDEGASKDA